MNVGKCVACGKTVYELEAMKVGGVSDPKVFHKGCFKCSNPGCTWKLDYANYTYFEGKAYCKNHNPMAGFSNNLVQAKAKVTTDSFELSAALTSPRVGVEKGVYKGAGKDGDKQ